MVSNKQSLRTKYNRILTLVYETNKEHDKNGVTEHGQKLTKKAFDQLLKLLMECEKLETKPQEVLLVLTDAYLCAANLALCLGMKEIALMIINKSVKYLVSVKDKQRCVDLFKLAIGVIE